MGLVDPSRSKKVPKLGKVARSFDSVSAHLTSRAYSAAFAVQNIALASSENSRTRRTYQGRITTPHIGRDNRPAIIDHTVTVTANTCIIADAMTKVAMVDPDLADQLLAAHGGQVVRFEMSEAA